jgi:hypothetical protein
MVSAHGDDASRHQKHPLRKQQRLKQAPGSAGARIVAAELLDEFLVAAHNAVTTLDACFRGEASAALARHLESTPCLPRTVSWHTSLCLL